MLNSFSATGLTWFVGALALIGLAFLILGLWPQRIGDELRCRKCSYVVENISSEKCPECGSILSGKGSVRGRRRRTPLLWIPGLVLLLVALAAAATETYRRVDWYRYKPTRWVINDLEARDGVKEERAFRELMRRKHGGTLTKYWEEQLADVSLRHHWQWANLTETQPIIAIQPLVGQLS